MELRSRFEAIQEPHCWQYFIRTKNRESDLRETSLTEGEVQKLRVSDFEFKFIPKDDAETCRSVRDFIERHEWLGKMPKRPTHRFVATYKTHIAGVVVMATPNSFSNLLGKESRHLEKLISRGACISWSPKNLGSALVMFAVRWMAKNTEFRIFTAYSDTEARELGTIYQACNFTYLGQNSGARMEYFDPANPDKGWFSDRQFRKTSQIRKYIKETGVKWEPHWSSRDKIHWNIVPGAVRRTIKDSAAAHRSRCTVRSLRPKHKYVHILGASKKETARLREEFNRTKPQFKNLPYPKVRVPEVVNTAAKILREEEKTLTQNSQNCRPLGRENGRTILTVKEVSEMLRVSQWTVYHLIKTDPTFPSLNVGIKKKFVVKAAELEQWLTNRSAGGAERIAKGG